MTNRYDILFRLPVYQQGMLAEPQEKLARAIVHSGLLRIQTDSQRNFVHYSGNDFDKTFSHRQLTEERFQHETREIIRRTLPGSVGRKGVQEVIDRLMQRFRASGTVSDARELEVARLLTQAAHPAVMWLCLHDRVELFVSYTHQVADMMAVHFWQEVGHSSGLQTVSGDGAAVYVSCGGNPFITEEAHKTYTTDGFPALARMQIIAAQELAHFADLKRDTSGRVIGRYSARLSSPMRAQPDYLKAQQADIRQVAYWKQLCHQLAIPQLARIEKQRQFYRDHRPYAPQAFWLRWRHRRLKARIKANAIKAGYGFISHFPERLHGSSGWASDILSCLSDMAFNLEPLADAYLRENKQEEQAIAVIEALARVPQQRVKWGEIVTGQCWPQLSRLYDDEVIAGAIAAQRALQKTTD